MTPGNVGPFSRPYKIHRVTREGVEATIEANGDERRALAADLDLAALHELTARFRLTGSERRIRVVGRVEARLEQTCVVTLEPFESRLDEEVEVEFEEPPAGRASPASGSDLELDPDHEPPDELMGDTIDLGSIAAEFLALGLDPHPRKPGVAFEQPPEPASESPFAALSALKRPGGPDGSGAD